MSDLPGPDELRVGTQERDDAVHVLGEHLAAGRLTAEEYDERALAAASAKTRAGMRPLFDDLPDPRPVFLGPHEPGPPRYGPATSAAPPYPASPYRGGPIVEYSDRSRVIAGILQVVLPFGIGRFYTGQSGLAVAQLLVTMFTFGVGAVWPFIDGIVLLARGGVDGWGRTLRD